jgi:hypothetical protein
MQSIHQIIGLSKQEIEGHSYKTDHNNRIIHENGKGISIQKTFSQYILYIGSVITPELGTSIGVRGLSGDNLLSKDNADDVCYSITLSQCDIAASRGKLGHIGSMEVAKVSQLDAQRSMTHVPVKPLHICADLEECQREEIAQVFDDYPEKMDLLRIMEENSFIEEIKVRLLGEPATTMFAFSKDGGDERIPYGYVYVNMELFAPLPL